MQLCLCPGTLNGESERSPGTKSFVCTASSSWDVFIEQRERLRVKRMTVKVNRAEFTITEPAEDPPPSTTDWWMWSHCAEPQIKIRFRMEWKESAAVIGCGGETDRNKDFMFHGGLHNCSRNIRSLAFPWENLKHSLIKSPVFDYLVLCASWKCIFNGIPYIYAVPFLRENSLC